MVWNSLMLSRCFYESNTRCALLFSSGTVRSLGNGDVFPAFFVGRAQSLQVMGWLSFDKFKRLRTIIRWNGGLRQSFIKLL